MAVSVGKIPVELTADLWVQVQGGSAMYRVGFMTFDRTEINGDEAFLSGLRAAIEEAHAEIGPLLRQDVEVHYGESGEPQ